MALRAIEAVRQQITAMARIALLAILIPLPFEAMAEPIQLKLSFFASERALTYLYGVKPFVDAVNAEAKGLVAIEVYADGALSKSQAQQPQLVLDGTADIAFIVPGVTPYRFPDNVLLELPGLFRDTQEGTLVYSRLIAARALRGYQDFLVIGAYTTDQTVIHSRKPIESLDGLKGLRLSANNPAGAEALQRLGAVPTVGEAHRVADAIGHGSLDGTTMSPTGLFQFGVAQVAMNHYLLGVGSAPLALVMNRKRFDGLPEAAKTIIRKYSGVWSATAWIESFGSEEKRLLNKLRVDPARHVVEPSPLDFSVAQAIYRSMIDSWAAKNAHNLELKTMLEKELLTIRSDQ